MYAILLLLRHSLLRTVQSNFRQVAAGALIYLLLRAKRSNV
jgi:hypothetical protein